MGPHNEVMRRIQVGLLGLSVIIMLLFVGSAIATRLRADPSKTGVVAPVKPMEKSADPAAKLGIAPANSPENASATNGLPTSRQNPSGLPNPNNGPPTTQH